MFLLVLARESLSFSRYPDLFLVAGGLEAALTWFIC